jgi:hypothetical protein
MDNLVEIEELFAELKALDKHSLQTVAQTVSTKTKG